MKTLKNNELTMVRDLLTRLNGVPSVKLAYASAKTIVKINNEIRDLEMIQAPDEDFRAFQSVLEEVKKKWARKRKNGEPATKIDRIGNQSVEVYDIPVEDLKSYQDEAEELELQFKSVIDTQRVKEKNYLDIQNEPSKVQFHLVEMSEVKHLLDKKKEGPGRLTGPQFLAMAFLLKKPVIKMDMIPDDVTQADMMALVEYFEL